MADLHKIFQEGRCPENMGCNVAKTCLCALLEDALEEITEWRECARYDPKMEGPAFKGWDRSQMDRCRKRFIETRDE